MSNCYIRAFGWEIDKHHHHLLGFAEADARPQQADVNPALVAPQLQGPAAARGTLGGVLRDGGPRAQGLLQQGQPLLPVP